jgi:hypothetical protein
MSPRMPLCAALVALSAGTLAACGSGPAAGNATPAPPAVALTVTANDGVGHVSTAKLTCRGTSTGATGYLRARAGAACRRARVLAAFLDVAPPPDRICTQIYGGPQTARVRGRIGARVIDRRFSRRNGCEIADWARAALLLPPGTGPAASAGHP